MKQPLLDTNILSYFLRGNPAVIEQFRIYRQYYTYISFSIFTYYEIKSGFLYKDARNQQQQFERLAEVSEVIAYDREIRDIATQIDVNLRIKGQLITPIDLFIAATAIYDFHFGNPIFCLNSIDSRTAISREILSLKD